MLGADAQRQVREKLAPKPKRDVEEVPIKPVFPSSLTPYSFSIPVPPSTNHLFAGVGKKRIKTKKYKAWLNTAGWKIQEQSPHCVPGDVAITLHIKRPNDFADIDNRLKSSLDLFVNMGLIEDDRFVVEIHASWSNVEACTVLIEPR